MKKSSSKKATLTPEQVKEITDYIQSRKNEGIDAKVIRKEVFKKFKIDTTVWQLNWEQNHKKVKGTDNNKPVADDQSLVTTSNIVRRSEPISFKHDFSEAEINERANILAQLEIDRDSLEDEKKNIANEYKTKIEEKETQIGKIAREINTGFEIRNETCEVVRDFNDGTKKCYYRGKLVKDEKLSASDYSTIHFPEETAA